MVRSYGWASEYTVEAGTRRSSKILVGAVIRKRIGLFSRGRVAGSGRMSS